MNIEDVKLKCAVCGKKSEQVFVKSSNNFHSTTHLDLRVVGAKPLYAYVGECPHCHFCNYSIDKNIGNKAEKTIASKKYQAILESDIDKLAKKFILCGLLYDAEKDTKRAGKMYHYASWAFDDVNDYKMAKKYRQLSIDRVLDKAIEEEDGETVVQYIDLCRRNGDFEKAKELIEMVGKTDIKEIDAVINFETKLIGRKNTSIHTLDEIYAKKKPFGDILKNLREIEHLSLLDLSQRSGIDLDVLKNYEANKVEPSLDVLEELCTFFSVNLDWFNRTKEYKFSHYHDLTTVEQNGKYALFDTREGRYLTPCVYDRIYTSNCDHHILLKTRDNEIIYSGIVDSFGKITDFRTDIELYTNFDREGTTVGRKLGGKKVKDLLVNYKGEALTKEYSRIRKKALADDSFVCYYAGYSGKFDGTNPFTRYENSGFKKENEKILAELKPHYLTSKGEEIDVNFKTIKDVCERIEKYGAIILDLVPPKFCSKSENYIKMFTAMEKFIDNEHRRDVAKDHFGCALFILKDMISWNKPTTTKELVYTPKDWKFTNKIESNYINKLVDDLYSSLNRKA